VRTALAATIGLVLTAGVASVPASAAPLKAPAEAREILPANDGWAASTTGTTGGAAADDAHVFVVRNRAELVTALAGGTDPTPRIVLIKGTIRANEDDAGNPLTCADYADPAYTLDGYLAAYDPAVWGRASRPTGPLEEARVRSQRTQAARIQFRVGANTTIYGLPNARLVGGNLLVQNVDNVIVRNVRFEDAADCFPAWDPTDGSLGNWNSAYDLVTLTGATHVWADHNTFSDGNNIDASQPRYFGRPYQVHDGALDIIRASDYVTASWNVFQEHDKTMLIGSTNTVGSGNSGSPCTTTCSPTWGSGCRVSDSDRWMSTTTTSTRPMRTPIRTRGGWGSTRRSMPRTTSCCAVRTSPWRTSSTTGAVRPSPRSAR
jgi:pectate lyase